MLDFIRKHQRLMMGFLFILIVPSFVFFGVSDYQSFVSNDVKLATIKEQSVTQDQFNQTWTNRLNSMRHEQGNSFDVTQVDTLENRRLWLDRLITESVIEQEMQDRHYQASDNMVRLAVATDPNFAENGKFSMEKYNVFLTRIGATGGQYENVVRRDQTYQMVIGPAVLAVNLPKKTTELLENAMTQERAVRLRLFEASSYDNVIEVTDEEIKKWFETNGKQLEIPEYVDVDYVLLNQAAAIAKVNKPTDEELQTYYQSNIRRYSVPERRHVKHIQIAGDNLDKANEVAAKAKADPSRFDALAKEYSIDAGTKNQGGELGLLRRGDIASLDEGIFTLGNTGVTDPIKIGNTYHIFNIVSIEPGSVKSYDEVKDEVLNEVKLQLASNEFADLATKLTSLVNDQRDSLQPVQDDLQLEVKHVTGITPTALLSADQVGSQAAKGSAVESLFDTPRLREVIFSREVFNEGYNSGTIEISPSEIMAVRIAKKVPAAIPSLDKVRDQIIARIKAEKTLALARSEGTEVLAEVQKNPSLTSFSNEVTLSRLMSNQPPSTLDAIMSAATDKLPVYVGFEVENGYGIARIDSVQEGSPEAKQLFTHYQVPVMENSFGNDVAHGIGLMLRDLYQVKIQPAAQQIIQGDANR